MIYMGTIMNETIITCSNCKTEIKLTESLAAPLLEATRQQFSQQLSQKEAEMSKREGIMREQLASIEKSQKELDQQIAEKMKAERQIITAEEAKKAREALADQISKVEQEKSITEEILKDRDAKLAEFRKNELELRKAQQKLQDDKAQQELDMQRVIDTQRIQYEEKSAQKEAEVGKREGIIREQLASIEKSQKELDQQIAEKMKAERQIITAEEAKKAREALSDQIFKAEQEKSATEELLKDRDAKLADFRKNELELRKAQQKLQDDKAQLELDMQRALDVERDQIRTKAQKEADDQSRLKIAEKEKTIQGLQEKLHEALRKAEQGSQQLQGEVQELELELLLQTTFPQDTIAPVPKGEHGGDVLHRVLGPFNQGCGTILWESKRTKNWSDTWLTKLREDQRAAKADIAIIMSQVLPKGIETFNIIEGIWIVDPRYFIPLAITLRQSLIELSSARNATEGQQTKMALTYQYLTGPRFKQRIEAIVEKFSDMQEDLNKERKLLTRLWAKREAQIQGVIESTAGMYGDLQGIAGKTLQEIEGLNIQMLENQEADELFQ